MQDRSPRDTENNNNNDGDGNNNPPVFERNRGNRPVVNALIRANNGFEVVHTAADALAAAYTYASPYSGYARSMWYNTMYFVPAGGAVLLHVLPFRPESKKRYLGHLEKALHVALSSAFLSTLAQEIFFLSVKDVTRTEYTVAVSVINGVVTAAAIAPSIWDLQMREGHDDLANWQKNIVKFALRPLALGAMPLFFLSTFSEHLHDAPLWMPLAVSAGLAGTMEVYQIADTIYEGLNRANRFINEVIADGFLTSLSTSSVFFIVIESLIAAYNDNQIPDEAFYPVMGLCITLMALTTTSSVINYMHGDNESELEAETLIADSSSEDDDDDHDYSDEGPRSRRLEDLASQGDRRLNDNNAPRVEVLDSEDENDVQQEAASSPKISKVSMFAIKETEETKTTTTKATMEIEKTEVQIETPKINK